MNTLPLALTNWFEKLPIETVQQIALNIERDCDLDAFRRVCRPTHDAVDGDSCSFWRRRFLAAFEKPNWPASTDRSLDNEHYRDAYRRRQFVLSSGVEFTFGNGSSEEVCLKTLRALILESFSEKAGRNGMSYESKNMARLVKFAELNGLQVPFNVSRKRKSKPNGVRSRLLLVIQSLLTPTILSFDSFKLNASHVGFQDSQSVAYANKIDEPIFEGVDGRDISMEWLLHQVNFWKHHLLKKEENTLYYAFKALDEADRPRYWTQQLSNTPKALGKHWKGAYSFVDRNEIHAVRSRQPTSNRLIFDEFNAEAECDAFQNLQLEFVERGEQDWPLLFEHHLKSLHRPTKRAKTRAQKRRTEADDADESRPLSFRFDGEGSDNYEAFRAAGWLNALPAQGGVPGWQRMTMMKFFEDEGTGFIDTNALWAYEGVVLPGGQIMLGRWWSPNDGEGVDMYSGPFIQWCVDGPKYEAVG